MLVATPAQLNTSLAAVQPGDIVTLKNGSWANVSISVSKGGSPGYPVVIRAETPGKVFIGGSSFLEINAPYVTVNGLFFYQGTTTKESVIHFNSHHGIVQNTAIVDYNPAAFQTGYYWVFFNGDYNLLDRCYFKGKNNMEPLIGNALEGSRHHTVSRCYFKNIPYAEANGREEIRVWGSGKFEERDDDGAFFTIANNLFDHADGEGTEIISLKSNHNQVLSNTVVATRGCINIRRGDLNVIKGNIILGQGIERAEGLRMSGERNLVQGNYVSGCVYGIQVSCGEYIHAYLTPRYKPDVKEKGKGPQVLIATYPQNRYDNISDNVLVDNSGPDLDVGADYKKHWPESQQVLLPENCLIKNNRIVRPKGGDSVVGTIPDTTAPLNRFRFSPNEYAGNLLFGGKNTFAPSFVGFRTQNIPAGWTEEQERSAFKPLTPDDVGPDWVIALRQAGNFSMEETATAASSNEPVAPKEKHHKVKTGNKHKQ